VTAIGCAVIGPGRMGELYARILARHPRADLVVIGGRSPDRVEPLAAELGAAAHSDGDWAAMLDAHPEIDAVVIATAEWAHLEPALAAAEAGKSVLLEKPVAPSVADAATIASALEASPTAMVCHTTRFDPLLARARERLRSGELGRVGYLYSRRNADLATASRVIGQIPMPFWITGHDVDLIRWFAGEEIVEVNAFGSELDSPEGDFLHAALRLESGARALIETNWMGPAQDGLHHSRFDVQAERGRIEVDLAARSGLASAGDSGAQPLEVTDLDSVEDDPGGASGAMLDAFLAAAADGGPAPVTPHDGLMAVVVCEAIQSSLESGGPVDVAALREAV